LVPRGRDAAAPNYSSEDAKNLSPQVDDLESNEQPLKFSQTFVLMPLPGGGGYWVLNDVFRLNYG